MAFTAILGTSDSYLGNIILGGLPVEDDGGLSPTNLPATVARVPEKDINTARMTRFTEQVSRILNGLLLSGVLSDTDEGFVVAGLFFVDAGEPSDTLGKENSTYLDYTTGILWKKVCE